MIESSISESSDELLLSGTVRHEPEIQRDLQYMVDISVLNGSELKSQLLQKKFPYFGWEIKLQRQVFFIILLC